MPNSRNPTNPRRSKLTLSVTAEEQRNIREWCRAADMHPGELVGRLALAWKGGRVFVLDEPTFQALQGAATNQIMTKVKRWAETTVREELHRQGFTLTPYDK